MKNNYKEVAERIRSERTIEEVARKLGLEVSASSKGKKTLCPFHDDTKPSMIIYDECDPRHYHCYACNAHGDIFNLVMELGNLNFKEAFNWICKEFNYSVEVDQKQKLDWQEPYEFAYEQMRLVSNSSALAKWCEGRKISKESLIKAGALYLERNSLTKNKIGLHNFGLSRDQLGLLEDTGILTLQNSHKNLYSSAKNQFLDLGVIFREVFWYENILFPIKNPSGKITGFAARENENKPDFTGPKYRYSKGFKRSENLFRIDHVFSEAVKHKKNEKSNKGLFRPFELFIVEGFLDALRLESIDKNAIAILGSHLSGTANEPDGQWKIIKELAEYLGEIPLYLNLFLDCDEAGKNGMLDAIPKLIVMKDKFALNIYLSIIAPSIQGQKDPDEIIKDNLSFSFEKHAYSVIDFYASTLIGCEVNKLSEEINTISALQESQLYSRLKQKFHFGDKSLFYNIFGKSGAIPFRILDEIKPIIEESKARLIDDIDSPAQILKAIQQCEISYRSIDFPIDYRSWDRLQKAGSLFFEEFQSILDSTDRPTEPYIGVLTPRHSGGEPRLKTLPSPEILVMQEYVLNKILTHYASLSGYSSRLAMFHNDIEDFKNFKSLEKVSFAYQVNLSSLGKGGRKKNTLFRNFSDCWNDFNSYILDRVRQAPSDGFMIHPARLDIRRYYDNISQSVVVKELEPLLKDAFMHGLSIPGLNASPDDSIKSKSVNNTLQWLLRVSFGYQFYAPNGNTLDWPNPNVGIPQGPNLSAWLANLILLPIDNVMVEAVKKINEDFRKTSFSSNNEKSSIVATYARYVDDIVLLAPSNEALSKLVHLFAAEIGKIGLSLSPKTEPMESQTRGEMVSWLFSNRGGFGRPSGEWSASENIIEKAALGKLLWLQTISRKQAILLLHSCEMVHKFEQNEIKEVLYKICQTKEDLKDRDYRYISARIWKIAYIVSGEDKASNDRLANSYLDEWSKLFPQSQHIDEVDQQNELIDFSEPLKIIWPFLVAIEGLQVNFLSRYDLSPNLSENERLRLESFRIRLAKFVLNDGIENLKSLYSAKFESFNAFSAFKNYIALRVLVALQQASLISPTHIQNKQFPLPNADYYREENFKRFLFSVANPSTYEGITTKNQALLIHELVALLELINNDYNVLTNIFFQRNEISLQNSKSHRQFEILRCLCTTEHQELVKAIDPDIHYQALQIFANIVTSIESQFSALKDRPLLMLALFENTGKKSFFILPHTQDIQPKAIKALEFNDSNFSKIQKIWLIVKSNINFENFVKNISIPEARSVELWKQQNERVNGLHSYYFKTDHEDWVYFINEARKVRDPKQKLEILLKLFEKLIENEDLANYLVTPFSIINSPYGFTFISAKRETSEELSLIKTRGIGALNYRDLYEVEVPSNYSYIWRIGLAISGLFDLSQLFVKIDRCKLQKIFDSHDDNLAESFLRQTIYVLCGAKWWSKVQSNTSNKLPFAVNNTIKRAYEFLYAKDSCEKICIWLNSRLQLSLISSIYENRTVLDRCGSFLNILEKIPTEVITGHGWLTEELKRNFKIGSPPNHDSNSHCPRAIWGQIQLVNILESFNKTELLSIICSFKARVICKTIRSLALILFSIHQGRIVEKHEKDIIDELGLPDNSIFAPWYQFKYGENTFTELLGRRLFAEPYDSSSIESVSPLGWYLAVLSLNRHLGTNIEDKLLESPIKQAFVSPYVVDQEHWPFVKNQSQATEIIDNAYISAQKIWGNLLANNGFQIKLCNENFTPFEKNMEIRSSDGLRKVFSWQITSESFPDEDYSRFESVAAEKGKIFCIWSEVWKDGSLVQISLLCEKFGKFVSSINENSNTHKTPNQTPIQKVEFINSMANIASNEPLKCIEKIIATKSPDNENHYVKKLKIPNMPESFDNTEKIDRAKLNGKLRVLSDFEKFQRLLWRNRNRIRGRHLRVAFIQYHVEESYTHPLKEICKKKIDNKELAKEPKLYTEKRAQNNNFVGKSCSEHRRRKILSRTIDACEELGVEILLLSEYSVRPETIEYLLNYTLGKKVAIWCGTFRQPYWKPTKSLFKNVNPLMAPMFIIQNGKDVNWRGKKYPAVALGEVFCPPTKSIEPMYKKRGENVQPGNYVYELICSESFCLTSPINRNGIMEGYEELWNLFYSNSINEAKFKEDSIEHDLKQISDWVSFSCEKKKGKSWKEFHPRRSILLVPAMSPRSRDYHLLGIANYLSASVCTVFCNSTKNSYGAGGSCFIGNGATKEDLNEEFLQKRIGPYNNIFPGIYCQGHTKNNGALGENDQALVVCDIDPEYQSEGKPRQQMLLPPLSLVAHIPIIEYSTEDESSTKTCEIDKEKTDCACGKTRVKMNDDFLHSLEKIMNLRLEANQENEHFQKEEFINCLRMQVKVFKQIDSWIQKKAKAYKHYSMQAISKQLPAVLYDFILVDASSKSFSKLPEIEVPPFRVDFDSIDPLTEEKQKE